MQSDKPWTGRVVELRGVAQESRSQALARLFQQHGASLKRFLRARLGDRDDLDDLVQDTFSKLAMMDGLLETLGPGNPRTQSYIFSVGNRVAIDLERRNKVFDRYKQERKITLESAGFASHPSVEVTLSAKEDLALVKKVLSEVRRDWSRAFVLNRFRNRSYKEVAEEMDISAKTVEKYIFKTMLKLREAIVDSGGKSGGDQER